MIYSPPHFDDPMHPSLYDGIINWAQARQQIVAGVVAMFIKVTQLGLVALGTIAAVVAGYAFLFWIMGPAPVL